MEPKKEIAGKTYKVNLSHNALGNIDDITTYIAFTNHQPLNAIKVVDGIFETIERIGIHPFAFRECDEIPTKNKSYRQAACLSWLVVYRITLTDIVILGIVNAAMKPSRLKALRKIR